LTFDVVTIFPGMFLGPLEDGLLARARRAGKVAARIHDLRSFADGPSRQVDDAPYGGGGGMVLKPEPFFRAVEWIRERFPVAGDRVVLLSPQGPTFDHRAARRLADSPRIVLLCGRYEGVDDRVREALADEEVSIGDVVLTGGELPALMVMDAVSRFVPGVLGSFESAERDSFEGGLLDFPHYTRPAEYRGRAVPDVLLSGDHGAIARWRAERAREWTRDRRPDLWSRVRTDGLAPGGRGRG
jgi:tRNA (guanine37-N1)-methyltransferase